MMMTQCATETIQLPGKRLGRLPRKSDIRSLVMSRYLREEAPPPVRTNFWLHRAQFSRETWGNDVEGCCTIAKQANMFRRFERLEQKHTISITTEEVHRVYRTMTQELYGGGDTGAYEEDALSRSRDPAKCLNDAKGRPLTIDAFIRLNPADQIELRRAIHIAAGHGIAICINLPIGFQELVGHGDLDYPNGQALVGPWMPGSWGGHSMWTIDYDEVGPWLEHTWGIAPQRITWRAAAVYIDEAHTVIDSVDAWRRRGAPLDLDQVVSDVNDVSRYKIVEIK